MAIHIPPVDKSCINFNFTLLTSTRALVYGNNVTMKIGQKIQIMRGNMTQRELAAKLGVTREAVANWECGLRSPRQAMLPLLAKALGVKLSALLAEIAPGEQTEAAS